MLSLEKIKEVFKEKDLTDEEAFEIRDSLHNLAEVIFEHWQSNKKVNPRLNGKTKK